MRAFGEWEEQSALLLALPNKNTDWAPYLKEILDSYYELITAASKYQKIILLAKDTKENSRFKMPNVEFAPVDVNDTWIRDYGVICADDGSGVRYYDFCFDAWGGKFESVLDNAANEELFRLGALKGKRYEIPLVLEGGSVDFNGSGVMLTTTECLLNANRGSRDKQNLEFQLKELFGLEQIIWLENGEILGDDTDSHVDTLARFIDPHTIAYAACDDKADPHYLPLSKMKSELEKTGFDLVPLPLPKPVMFENRRLGATYANFIFINDALIVPTYGDKKADETALNALAKHVKNRDIIPIDARVFIRQNGSLHCSSQNIYKGSK